MAGWPGFAEGQARKGKDNVSAHQAKSPEQLWQIFSNVSSLILLETCFQGQYFFILVYKYFFATLCAKLQNET